MTKLLSTFAFILCLGGLAAAQAPAADNEGFVPVAPNEQLAPGESLPAGKLVATAYGFILAGVVVFTTSVALRARRVEAELAELRKKIG